MNKFLCLAVLLLAMLSAQSQNSTSFPNTEKGMEKGVSACFAGILNGQLLLAGGCNFPDTAAADGGAKRFYQGIYATPIGNNPFNWKQIGRMPEPMAYGVSLQAQDALILIGGNNDKHASSSVFSLHMDAEGKLLFEALPSLPCTLDNMAGAISGNTLYLIGGNADGKPSTALFALSLKSLRKGWRKLSDIPGSPRVQPVCAAVKGKVYVWGGFFANGEQSEVATDGWVYDTKHKDWKPLPAPMNENNDPITLSGGTATTIGERIVCMGGVNQAIFLDAISGRYQLTTKEEYLRHPQTWYKFNDLALTFSPKTYRWESPATRSASFASAGATAVQHGNSIYLIGGETQPGIRSTSIIAITIPTIERFQRSPLTSSKDSFGTAK